ELGDLRVTIDDIPPALGKLRILVRKPRFAAALELATDDKPEFDRVLDVQPGAGQRSLTVVLARPRRAGGAWPRRDCKACRVDVELTGLFGGPEALDAFFARALQDASAIDAAFGAQSQEPATRPGAALRDFSASLSAEARRCGVALDPVLRGVQSALGQLDAARALLYGKDASIPDAPAVFRSWAPPIRGRRCIGSAGAAPVRNADEDAVTVARLLGGDERRLRIARASDIAAARQSLRQSGDLLCEAPQPDVTALFSGLEDKELGPIAERLEEIFDAADPRHEHDELARAVLARTSQLLCKVLDAENIQQRAASVVGYKVFVEGGTRILELLPQPLICGSHLLTAREVRRRLRPVYREALDRHAVKERLCAVRSGKCPDEVAASVRKLFGLHRPDLAAPASPDSRRLEFP